MRAKPRKRVPVIPLLSVIHLFRIHVMLKQSLLCHLLKLCARSAVVTVWINGDASAGSELAPYLDVARIHELDEILHDDIHAVLMEVSVVAEAEEVQLQGLGLHHSDIRNIGNVDSRKVRLARDRAEARELRAVELDEVVVVRMLVFKGFQYLRRIVHAVFCLISQ